MSNQGYWKDIAIINNFHVYTIDQFKTETYEQNAKTWNRECCHCAISLWPTCSNLTITQVLKIVLTWEWCLVFEFWWKYYREVLAKLYGDNILCFMFLRFVHMFLFWIDLCSKHESCWYLWYLSSSFGLTWKYVVDNLLCFYKDT